MSLVHRRGPVGVEANLTPMIDVTFLLIVFFVLVSQIVEVESVDLVLPELMDPQTDLPGEEQRTVVNVVPGVDGRAFAYRIGGRHFPPGEAGGAELAQHVAALLRKNPGLRVNLRADQRTHYQWVQPVLQSITAAAAEIDDVRVAPRVNLVIVREE